MDRWKVDGTDVGSSRSAAIHGGVTQSQLLNLSQYISLGILGHKHQKLIQAKMWNR